MNTVQMQLSPFFVGMKLQIVVYGHRRRTFVLMMGRYWYTLVF